MPVTPTYPGVYIEEIPSGVRTIIGVATSITAFVGRALRGPVNDPVRVQSMGEFNRAFGGLWADSTMSYAVDHFFLNGGTDALIVRLINGATTATFSLGAEGTSPAIKLEAANPGAWGGLLRLAVDHVTADPTDNQLFNLTVVELSPDVKTIVGSEVFRNVSVNAASPRYLPKLLAAESQLVRMPVVAGDPQPTRRAVVVGDLSTISSLAAPSNTLIDGAALTPTEYDGNEDLKTGIYALDKADLFNLLCIPPFTPAGEAAGPTLQKAAAFCHKRRAVLLVDPPLNWTSVAAAESNIDSIGVARDDHVAVYFPRLLMPDPLQENRPAAFAPCGAVAGVIARTDGERGVWKAPAGQDAVLRGVQGLSIALTDGENGRLNPLGLNCLRSFPVIGTVVWGARTYRGADRLSSEWKYLPVRRLALYIEETLFRNLQWVVFEPNDEPLWAQVRLNVGAFMQNLFRQGAFQGTSPREAYLVKCDKETTTQNDIDRGIVNIVVGFAPLKPAEFVIIKIQQLAGQLQI
jgi:uncharacterized protein